MRRLGEFDATRWDYKWRLKSKHRERFGLKCRIIKLYENDIVDIEFEDGFKVRCSRMSVHRKEEKSE